LTGAATDNAVERLHYSWTIFLLIPLKHAIFAEIKALRAADTFILVDGGVPGDIFAGNFEHLFLLVFTGTFSG